MNREIKFRVWDKNTLSNRPKMVYWSQTKGGDDFWEIYEQSESLMQFTGLKDKNGREIYEGDIIKENIGNQRGNFEVVYFERFGCFAGRNYVDAEDSFSKEERINLIFQEIAIIPLEYEIIGNIYENENLFKQSYPNFKRCEKCGEEIHKTPDGKELGHEPPCEENK